MSKFPACKQARWAMSINNSPVLHFHVVGPMDPSIFLYLSQFEFLINMRLILYFLLRFCNSTETWLLHVTILYFPESLVPHFVAGIFNQTKKITMFLYKAFQGFWENFLRQQLPTVLHDVHFSRCWPAWTWIKAHNECLMFLEEN